MDIISGEGPRTTPAPRLAAAQILFRRREGRLELFLVERSPGLAFLPGHWAFPGGSVEAGDELLPWAGPAPPEDARGLCGAAARELLEETGIVLTEPPARPAGAERTRRRLVTGDPGALGTFLAEQGLRLAPRFERAARLVTPPISRARFDTTFFFVEEPGEPLVLPGELVRGEWVEPARALEEWRSGRRRIAPPVLRLLEILRSASFEAARAEIGRLGPHFEGSGGTIPSQPGYEFLPFTAPPLPPEIPTNTILVGEERFFLVDPAPKLEQGRAHLERAVAARLEEGHHLEAILLTHHHPDHVGALEPLAERFRAPVWAHRRAGEILSRRLDRAIAEGDRLELGAAPDGSPGWHLRVLFTPGHAEDHLAFHDPHTRSLIAGDLLSPLVSMYVGFPGGDLDDYFASLERLKGLGVETYYPAHGAPAHDLARAVEETLAHRRARIEEVYARLGSSPSPVPEIAEAVYRGSASRLRPLFERAARAALEHLVRHGRAERSGGDSYRRAERFR